MEQKIKLSQQTKLSCSIEGEYLVCDR